MECKLLLGSHTLETTSPETNSTEATLSRTNAQLPQASCAAPCPNTSIQRIDSIQHMFREPSYRRLRNVEVTIEDDHVLLSGTVSSYYLKQMAQERVRQVCPTMRLRNHVVVEQD